MSDGPETSLEAALAGVQADWESLGASDPLWAVRSDPSSRGGGWDVDEFFASGTEEIAATAKVLAELRIATSAATALDFGCGVGRVTQALATLAPRVVGVDVSEPMLERARELDRSYGRVEYVLNTDPDLRQFADRSFDIVYSKLVLQHLPPILMSSYLSELARLVAYRGALVVQIPSEALGRIPLPDDSYRCDVFALDVPERVVIGSRFDVHATVRNTSSNVWQGGESQLAVGTQWRSLDGSPLGAQEGRALVADDLEPGAARAVTISVAAPFTPGEYMLVVDMVHEGVTWFRERYDGAADRRVSVTPRPLLRRIRGRIGRALPKRVTPPQRSAPPVGMHGMAEADVDAIVTAQGLCVLRADRDHAAPGWRSLTYYATREGQE